MVATRFLNRRNLFAFAVVAINCFWFFALYPARMGADAVGLLQTIRSGQSTDWWSGAFYWLFRVTSINGAHIGLTALFQLAAIFFCMIYFFRSLPLSQKIQNISMVIFFLLPIYGFFAMSISHDLTQTAGIILLVSIELRKMGNKKVNNLIAILLIASLFLLTTQTGIVLSLLAILRHAFYLRLKKSVVLSIVILAIFTCSNMGLTSGLNVHGNFIPSSQVKYWPFLAGIKCVAQHSDAEISLLEWEVLLEISSRENWKLPVSCQNYDTQINTLKLYEKNYDFSDFEFLRTYVSIAGKNPAIVAMSHIQRARGVLPPLLFQPPDNQVSLDASIPIGQRTNTALQSGAVFLHPSIDIVNGESSKPRVFRVLEIPAQGLGFLFNQASWFWGWGGLWLTTGTILLAKLISNQRIKRLIAVFYAPLAMHAILLFFIPTSVPRYYMYSIMTGIAISLGYFVSKVIDRGDRIANQ